jgi:hypothetical protein
MVKYLHDGQVEENIELNLKKKNTRILWQKQEWSFNVLCL